jgi:glucans biosynthesis protein
VKPNSPNTGPMRTSLRCGAKTRRGAPCNSPAVKGRARCRMHGGADGSGAPAGNQNALKHGHVTRAALAEHKAMRATIRAMRQTLREFAGD